ncbi:MAG: DUF2339 domain-containing protein [Acidobacteria bacterium]|nr:DUF2339 domain-containing protein [Acidobacteriota bacterium]
MTDDLNARVAELEETLRRNQNQIAALTRRVFQLETGEAAPPPIHQQPAEAAPPPPVVVPAKDWEATVGTNWLNRIGVILLVIGITLFLGYAMASMGPAGKIAVGTSVAALMLATGYWYEYKGNFRPFSLAIVAGGFAVLYATAYASHAVPASRIFENLAIGIAIQTLIAVVAVWQATQFGSERAAILAFLAAYLGLASSSSLPFIYGGAYPLAICGLWLSHRMKWADLPWSILIYTWLCEIQTGRRDWEFQYWGHPVAWFNVGLFSAFEIKERMREYTVKNPAWILVNDLLFVFATFAATRFESSAHVASVFALLTLAGLVASSARVWLGVRHEALAEAMTLLCASVWVIARFANSDPLLLLMLVLAVAMIGLVRNAMAPTAALTLCAEGVLALLTLVTLITFPETKLMSEAPLRIHLALPQTLALIVCLFAAGRWFTTTPWPSWAALVGVAVVTLVTIPKTMGTIVLAFEAILAVAAGLYLARRPIRLGCIALFLFSILKVFVYDLSELDTLPRIFSFIVLGLLLISASWGYTKYRQQLQKYL